MAKLTADTITDEHTLSDEERETLRVGRGLIEAAADDPFGYEQEDVDSWKRALAVLDKLLGGGK